MASYSNDPRWITARFSSKCSQCKTAINKGSSVYYYPATKTVLCDGDDCGGQAARDFEDARFDEECF
jgi:hypothetical protein